MVVDRDDFEVRASCELVIPDGLVIEDRGAPGIVQVRGSGIQVRFAAGSVLRGAPADRPWDQLEGTGIRLDDVHGVTIQGARVHGFRAGIWASGCDRLTIEDADLSDNFRQRLGSTPVAEDSSDWLWPHANDDNEWLRNYGAALYLEDGEEAVVRRVRVRRGQNGIVLDRMEGCQVYDNDCSFLSGWGLAMWRSSRNTISRNAFDFCVRGYSHGVYNRGQDSAGILMFEQCSENWILENSATHGGDGFFGFAGREALGEVGEHEAEWHRRRGNNDNLLYRNDFSYAPAHGIEMTFSFGNRFLHNRLVGNAICGIWGGFSQETVIDGNLIADNGDAGYGLERGGVNIDRSRGNWIRSNRFRGNRCGVHLWSLPTAFLERPWGQVNDLSAGDNLVIDNRFEGDELALHLRGDCQTVWLHNELTGVEEELRLEDGASLDDQPDADHPRGLSGDRVPPGSVLGDSRPVGARASLAGRENIIVGPWGPWDHREPLLLLYRAEPGARTYQVLPREARPTTELLEAHASAVDVIEYHTENGDWLVRFEATEAGLHRYQAEIEAAERRWPVEGWLLAATWRARFFPWTVDPREDLEGWRAQAEGAAEHELEGLQLHFDHGGPAALIEALAGTEGLGSDHFGSLAATEVPLPAGRYRLRTLSDDGIRVLVDGQPVVEDWSWHAPKEILGEFELTAPRKVRIEVEHFEIDGFAKLVVELERVD